MPKLSSVLAALGISAFAWTGVAAAATTTYVQTSDNCTGGCGINAGNFITVDQSGGLTTITVNLATGWAFVDTGANGGGGSVNFGFGSSIAGLTVTNLSGNGWSSTAGQFFVEGGTLANPSIVSTALRQAPAANGNTFSFTNGISITCNTSGGSTACSGPLSFTLNTVLALVGDATAGKFFWLDVLSSNGNTGLIDFGPGVSQIPLPPAVVLFGTALVGLGVLGRRRKNKGLASSVA
jgi:hypothetical protein